jgi:ubiquinone/menaquinone biosynthesis C-methylase UbiE
MTMEVRPSHQRETDACFGEAATYWRDVYAQEGLQGLVYRERMQTVLGWIDALSLPPGARVLEVGCGAGHTSVELARRGFAVECTDSSREMVALASQRIVEAGLSDAMTASVADVHALPHPTGSFAVVVTVGVLPWLHSPERGIEELARVLRPGGHAIVTADNRVRLNMLVDPSENPLLAPLRVRWHALKRRHGWRPSGPNPRRHSPSTVDRMLLAAGLEPQRSKTLGFGPFTVLRRPILGDRLGLALHRWLQRLADRGTPGLRRAGWHYLVSARLHDPATNRQAQGQAAKGG